MKKTIIILSIIILLLVINKNNNRIPNESIRFRVIADRYYKYLKHNANKK